MGDFLDALASDAATPGGGAVGAVAGAALIAMVGRLTAGKKGYEGVTARMEELAGRADLARDELLELADRDAAASTA